MSDNTLTIGAPSLRGEDARAGLDKKLSGLSFPIKVRATNHFPFKASFPWAGKLFLMPSGHSGHAGETVFEKQADLERFVTDVQSVAELRKAPVGIVLEWAAPKSRTSNSSKPSKTDNA